MATWFFDAPGGVKDFKNPQHWHNEVAAGA
jgi:hypothetical protein